MCVCVCSVHLLMIVYSQISTMTGSVQLQKGSQDASKMNNQTFNDTKYQHVSFASDTYNISTVEYIISPNKITSHQFMKDLGIVVSNNISFKNDIQDISRRCSQLNN